MHQGFNYCKQFLRVDVPVVLTAVHCLRHERDRVELPLLIALLQYSADGIGRGIGVHNEGTLKVWVLEYGCSRYCMDQGIERLLTFGGPYKSASLHT